MMADEQVVTEIGRRRAGCAASPGKYLTFQLGEEIYGIEILKIQEIIGLMSVTRVPRTPDFVRGVINLRGKVIPVIDLRRKFAMEAKEDTDRTCIIVVQVSRKGRLVVMGLIVDQVSEVLDVRAEQLEAPPAFGDSVDIAFMLGVAKIAEKVVMLVDVDRVLAVNEVDAVKEAAERAEA